MTCARSADIILTGFAPLTRRVIERLERCRLIAAYTTGTDAIDVLAATEKGILVTNCGDYCSEEVAEHTLALIMCLVRGVSVLNTMTKKGRWVKAVAIQDTVFGSHFLANVHRLSKLTLGILGFRRIGRKVAEKALGLGFNVITHDPFANPHNVSSPAVEHVGYVDLFKNSDVLSIHLPLNQKTRNLVGRRELALMKPGSYLVNTSRAAVVEEGALVEAVLSGRLAGVALDVMWEEPPSPSHPLFRHENVIVTPHIGFYSVESMKLMHERVVDQVLSFLRGQVPSLVVNPEVTMSSGSRSQGVSK